MRIAVVFFALIVFSIVPVFGLSLETVEILSGYFEADLEGKDDYQGVPLLVSFNFDAKPLLNGIGLNIPGSFNLIAEPFFNTIISPENNIEVGSNFLVKYGFPLTKRIMPYIKGGVGVLYMSQGSNEQSTKYNFLPQGGGGVHFFFSENTALTVEYRYRHLSNASVKSPNSGIDADIYLTGIAIFF